MRRVVGLIAIPLIAILAITGLHAWQRRHPKPDTRITYGADPSQHADLWLPRGKGPFPVVMLVHGGCWRSSVDAADQLNRVAGDLRKRGIAVWNVDYRGVNQAAFPATFTDVAAGADGLRDAAKRYPLDLSHVVAVGHSAGAHLVLWLAARRGIARSSPLHSADPLALVAAIGLGAPPDLAADATPGIIPCGPQAIKQLVGEPTAQRPDVYADTSPARLPQPSIPIILVSGGADRVVPPTLAEAYVRRVGGRPKHVVVPGASHGTLVLPGNAGWTPALTAIEDIVHPQ